MVGEERGHDGGDLFGVGDERHVPAVVDVQGCVREQPRMIRALRAGTMGSSSPARISVRWRIKGSQGRLVQPAPASSWCR